MNRTLFFSMLLICLVFSQGLAGKLEAATVEHLVWKDTGPGHFAFLIEPDDYTQLEGFTSKPFLKFSVPASPNSKTIFFELWAQTFYMWTDYQFRRALSIVRFELISNLIPPNIKIYNSATVLSVNEYNAAGNYDISYRRSKRNAKFVMKKGKLDWWVVVYIDTGEVVPASVALPILETLINKGFDVEVYTDGYIRGVHSLALGNVHFEVTRLSE